MTGPDGLPDDAELDLGFARLDLGRQRRRGFPEAVFCAGKTPEQTALIARGLAESGTRALFTRAGADHAEAIRGELPDAAHHPEAALVAWPPRPPKPRGGRIVVVSAGTSDLPVASEALLTAVHLGRRAELVADVGVAALHRLLRRLDVLRAADCVVVVAGMDGAVPTSVGYGAAFGGLAPLLTMLNACSGGVAVMNIDNGYGAGLFAGQVTAPRRRA
jgi:pyridinium-3,5-biscarboxylic acid mononucleotide synthase